MPNTADGRNFPRYCINLGVLLFSLNMINGKKRVAMVPSTHMAMVIICCVSVMVNPPVLSYRVVALTVQATVSYTPLDVYKRQL